jgi:hypothetical protein
MVMPLVEEHNPKCYLCHEGFDNLEKLRIHQNTKHKEFFESHEKKYRTEPAPGDVTIF